MGSHRADNRAPRPDASTPYVGKRVAQRTETEAPSSYVGKRAARPVAAAPAMAVAEPVVRPVERTPTVELPALRDIALFDPLTDSSTSQLKAIQPAGKRRATKHAGSRGPLFKTLPSIPVAVGVATLAVAIGGAVVSADPQLASSGDRVTAANAVTGSFGNGSVTERVATVSRDSERDTLAQANGTDLVAQAERSAAERSSALDSLAKAAEKEAAEIALNRWVLPLHSYRLTAKFGEYGLWSSYHTGLDFAAPVGTPIYAVTNGTVSSAGFDGAYGNKTVITLEDGTELWFCHQSAFNVSAGQKVRAGELIGYVGATGHVTGPHMHLEVRPGGGDPVDPDAALRQHGVTP
ncbi:M23 family metallopeptidase [Nocardioides sp. LML1-1-1.1]|uniref:M23 family metallopeptidase n=1 Tax=Nocardioides sp. LML1-1-1.1 TaxID=3135248 RepID=UPI00342A8036